MRRQQVGAGLPSAPPCPPRPSFYCQYPWAPSRELDPWKGNFYKDGPLFAGRGDGDGDWGGRDGRGERNACRCYSVLRRRPQRRVPFYCPDPLSSSATLFSAGWRRGVDTAATQAPGDEAGRARLSFPSHGPQSMTLQEIMPSLTKQGKLTTKRTLTRDRQTQPQPRRRIAPCLSMLTLPDPRRSFPSRRPLCYMEKGVPRGAGGKEATLIMVPRTLLRVPGIRSPLARGARRAIPRLFRITLASFSVDSVILSLLWLAWRPWDFERGSGRLRGVSPCKRTILCSVQHPRAICSRQVCPLPVRCRDNNDAQYPLPIARSTSHPPVPPNNLPRPPPRERHPHPTRTLAPRSSVAPQLSYARAQVAASPSHSHTHSRGH